ncbi:MAG: Wzz/FepE/Etk N-terminal domain-containing protein [Sporolactobacillus sp.]
MEETISLQDIFGTLRKHLALIACITLLAVIISAVLTYFFITPKYDASTQILVNQSNANTSSLYSTNAVQTNVQLVNTYSVIIDNPAVLNQVIGKLHLKLTADQLGKLLKVSTEQNSQVFTLTAETDNPALSVRIVNNVAIAFRAQVQKVMNVDNVSILSPANVSASLNPVKPKPLINLAVAFVVGLMIAVGLAFLLDYLDNTLKTENDLEQVLGLPVLGTISAIKGNHEKHTHGNARSAGNHQQLRGINRAEVK